MRGSAQGLPSPRTGTSARGSPSVGLILPGVRTACPLRPSAVALRRSRLALCAGRSAVAAGLGTWAAWAAAALSHMRVPRALGLPGLLCALGHTGSGAGSAADVVSAGLVCLHTELCPRRWRWLGVALTGAWRAHRVPACATERHSPPSPGISGLSLGGQLVPSRQGHRCPGLQEGPRTVVIAMAGIWLVGREQTACAMAD